MVLNDKHALEHEVHSVLMVMVFGDVVHPWTDNFITFLWNVNDQMVMNDDGQMDPRTMSNGSG